MKRIVEIYFHSYWFTAAIHIRKVPAGLYYLEKICDRVSDFLDPIPLPNYSNLGMFFWDQTCLRLIGLMSEREKITVIMLPWRFAKEKFPEEYEKYRKERVYFEKDLEKRIGASVEAYNSWMKSYKKIQDAWLREKVNVD